MPKRQFREIRDRRTRVSPASRAQRGLQQINKTAAALLSGMLVHAVSSRKRRRRPILDVHDVKQQTQIDARNSSRGDELGSGLGLSGHRPLLPFGGGLALPPV
jgi:hypothetical protein